MLVEWILHFASAILLHQTYYYLISTSYYIYTGCCIFWQYLIIIFIAINEFYCEINKPENQYISQQTLTGTRLKNRFLYWYGSPANIKMNTSLSNNIAHTSFPFSFPPRSASEVFLYISSFSASLANYFTSSLMVILLLTLSPINFMRISVFFTFSHISSTLNFAVSSRFL